MDKVRDSDSDSETWKVDLSSSLGLRFGHRIGNVLDLKGKIYYLKNKISKKTEG